MRHHIYLLKTNGIPSVLNLSIERNKIVKEVLSRKIYDCIRYFIYLNTLIRREMTTANFVDFSFIKYHFSLKQVELNRLIKDRCLGVSMDFSALFMIVSYIPFMTYLTFGKGELQTGIHIFWDSFMVVSSFICLLNRFHWSKAVAALGLIISMSVRYRLTLCRQPKSEPCTCVHLPSMIYQNRHFTKNIFWKIFAVSHSEEN